MAENMHVIILCKECVHCNTTYNIVLSDSVLYYKIVHLQKVECKWDGLAWTVVTVYYEEYTEN